MGRLEFSLTNCIILAVALSTLTGCATPAQTAANPQYSPPALITSLIGSTPATLSAEFGQPTLLRVDGAAQVWIYHSTSCGLNLVLYPDPSGTPRVAMVSAADGDPAGAAPADCTASLQQAHFDAAVNPAATSASLQTSGAAALEHPASS